MNTNTFMVNQMLWCIMSRQRLTGNSQKTVTLPLLYLILGLQCLKNWRNLGIIMLRGRLRASLSSSSDESSQIFCSAPNEPWDTDIHREAVKSKTQTHKDTEERTRLHQKIRPRQEWMHGANVQLNAWRGEVASQKHQHPRHGQYFFYLYIRYRLT